MSGNRKRTIVSDDEDEVEDGSSSSSSSSPDQQEKRHRGLASSATLSIGAFTLRPKYNSDDTERVATLTFQAAPDAAAPNDLITNNDCVVHTNVASVPFGWRGKGATLLTDLDADFVANVKRVEKQLFDRKDVRDKITAVTDEPTTLETSIKLYQQDEQLSAFTRDTWLYTRNKTHATKEEKETLFENERYMTGNMLPCQVVICNNVVEFKWRVVQARPTDRRAVGATTTSSSSSSSSTLKAPDTCDF